MDLRFGNEVNAKPDSNNLSQIFLARDRRLGELFRGLKKLFNKREELILFTFRVDFDLIFEIKSRIEEEIRPVEETPPLNLKSRKLGEKRKFPFVKKSLQLRLWPCQMTVWKSIRQKKDRNQKN